MLASALNVPVNGGVPELIAAVPAELITVFVKLLPPEVAPVPDL